MKERSLFLVFSSALLSCPTFLWSLYCVHVLRVCDREWTFLIPSLLAAYYYGKRKKIVKPPIGEASTESGHPKPARRRKRRKSIFVQKKRRSSAVDLAAGSGEVRPAWGTFLHTPRTCGGSWLGVRPTCDARCLHTAGSRSPVLPL